jgi:hypothetical protein
VRRRFFCHVFDEWIEVSAKIHREWWGVRGYLMEDEPMIEAGWTIERQSKSYGEHVRITLGPDGLELEMRSNPLGLQIGAGTKALLDIESTRQNADKLGMQLAQVFETAATMKRPAPRNAAVIEMPKAWGKEDLSPEDRDPPPSIVKIEEVENDHGGTDATFIRVPPRSASPTCNCVCEPLAMATCPMHGTPPEDRGSYPRY